MRFGRVLAAERRGVRQRCSAARLHEKLVCSAAVAHYRPPRAPLLTAGLRESTSCVCGQRSILVPDCLAQLRKHFQCCRLVAQVPAKAGCCRASPVKTTCGEQNRVFSVDFTWSAQAPIPGHLLGYLCHAGISASLLPDTLLQHLLAACSSRDGRERDERERSAYRSR